MPENCCKI